MPPEYQWIATGGTTVFMAWLIFQLIEGKLISRKVHDEIVAGYQRTNDRMAESLKEVGEEAKKALSDVSAVQREALEEQRKTIAMLTARAAAQAREAAQ